jgi:hypothetical protein
VRGNDAAVALIFRFFGGQMDVFSLNKQIRDKRGGSQEVGARFWL